MAVEHLLTSEASDTQTFKVMANAHAGVGARTAPLACSPPFWWTCGRGSSTAKAAIMVEMSASDRALPLSPSGWPAATDASSMVATPAPNVVLSLQPPD